MPTGFHCVFAAFPCMFTALCFHRLLTDPPPLPVLPPPLPMCFHARPLPQLVHASTAPRAQSFGTASCGGTSPGAQAIRRATRCPWGESLDTQREPHGQSVILLQTQHTTECLDKQEPPDGQSVEVSNVNNQLSLDRKPNDTERTSQQRAQNEPCAWGIACLFAQIQKRAKKTALSVGNRGSFFTLGTARAAWSS